MSTFRKMKLVPEDEYAKFAKYAEQQSNDSSILKFSESSPAAVSVIQTELQQNIIPDEASNEDEISNKEKILSFMPKRIKLRVAKLLNLFESHSDVICVNHSQYPLMKINNCIISNTNCIILLKSLYCK